VPEEMPIFASGALGNVVGEVRLVEGGIGPETKAALGHLIANVEAAGGARETIAKVLVFIADMDEFGAMNAAYAEVMGGHRPARSTVAVKGLALGARIALECVAAVK